MNNKSNCKSKALKKPGIKAHKEDHEKKMMDLAYKEAKVSAKRERDMFMIRTVCNLKCSITRDGNMFCCLLGTDLQEGIAGFGKTPFKSIEAFCKEFGI